MTLDDIAHHAGVGVGTVYRRFPNKESLIDALFEERIQADLRDRRRRARRSTIRGTRFVYFLEKGSSCRRATAG